MSETQQPDAAAEAGLQSGDAPVETTETQEASPSETPVQDDKSWQSRYDRLKSQVGNDLEAYIRQFGGGQQIVGFLKQLESVVGNPTLGPMVQNYLKTGQIDLPKPKTDSGWEEPEPEWKAPISSVLSELQSLKQELTGLKTRQGMTAITDHTRKFLSEYPMDESEKTQFDEYMQEQWQRLTANPAGANLLGAMDYRTYKTLALPGIEDFRQKIEGRRIAKARGQVTQRATDAPVTASGKETKPNGALPTDNQALYRDVRAAFVAAMRE